VGAKGLFSALGLGFGVFVSALVAQRCSVAVAQSVVWLPTGVAIAGVWILGPRSAWSVALAILLHRAVMGTPTATCVMASLGTTSEALLGWSVLRWLGIDPNFARVRDVLVLFAAAAVAPLASILVSILTRRLDPGFIVAPFYSGWLGWWRMNALGALTLVPLLLCWSAWRPRLPRRRTLFEAAALIAAIALFVWSGMVLPEPGVGAILLLYALLSIALVAALRFGPRGAISTAAFGTLLVVLFDSLEGGAFLEIPWAERHAPMQVFGLSLVSIPLVIGSLLAEREARVRRTEQQLALQTEVLELVACGRPDRQVLEVLVLGIEAALPGCKCSILLLEGRALRLACAPSLPDAYNRAIDGIVIGPSGGSCGTAAHERRTVIVEDIGEDPLWREFRALALAHGLRACWSIPIRNASGGVLGIFAIYHAHPQRPGTADLALVERAAALVAIALQGTQREEQLRQAQRMEAVGKLAGGVAHDFNNLLTAIMGLAETLSMTLPPESAAARDVDEILRAAERGAGLTRQLLTFSRQQVLTSEVLDLGEVVERFAGMLKRLIGEDIRFVHRRSAEAASVRADRGQLEQVLMNLVLNARDAMPRGGTLTITTEVASVDGAHANGAPVLAPGTYATLAVRDTGVGMSEEVRARAFDPFFTTKPAGKGTGIGLSSVYGIVQQNGGVVWIESSPGEGTTVWIRLKRVEEAPRSESGVLIPRAPVRAATVLLAEDEKSVREFVQATLARAGHTVLAAESGRAALELAGRHQGPLDLLVTDVVMPTMGGTELARELHLLRPQLPVLYISGYASEGQRLPDSASGEVAYLPKPFTSARLKASITELLARAAERSTVPAG
jgi:signal transduction histidine kinase/ActR/RegA family two-component response regulator